MKQAFLNGGRVPDKEFKDTLMLIPPFDYETLAEKLSHEGYDYCLYQNSITQPDNKTINKVGVYCSPILMNDTVDKLEKLCGKKFRVTKMPNLQEIFITLK